MSEILLLFAPTGMKATRFLRAPMEPGRSAER